VAPLAASATRVIAIPDGPKFTGISAPGLLVATSIGVTVWLPWLVT
jgi:hypothetical protein